MTGYQAVPNPLCLKGSMDERIIRRREVIRCWILSCGLLQVFFLNKIFASCIGVSSLVPGGVMGVDVCAYHLMYLGNWLEFDNEILVKC